MKKMTHGITATAFAISAMVATGVNADDKVLNLYNWAEYMPMEVINAFEEEYQVDVNYSTFESNESMYAKLKLLNSEGYDLAFASTYFIERMINENMLAKIDKSQISHFDQLRPGLLGQSFDQENNYSLPYVFGVTGISYNRDYVDGSKVTKWADLWREDFRGQVMLLNDVRDVFGMALKAQGHSINSTDEAEIKQAYQYLRDLRDNVVVYNSDAHMCRLSLAKSILASNGMAMHIWPNKRSMGLSLCTHKKGLFCGWITTLSPKTRKIRRWLTSLSTLCTVQRTKPNWLKSLATQHQTPVLQNTWMQT